MMPLRLTPDLKADHLLFRNEHNLQDRWNDRAYFAGERLTDNSLEIPTLQVTEIVNNIPVVALLNLVVFQLSRFKLDDKVDLRDLIEVGLIDANWPAKLPPELASRLQKILDDPEG